jgi:diacylglycerol kinase family enzyme
MGGTAYSGVLSRDQWTLRPSSIPKLAAASTLILHAAHIERLQNADITVLVSSKSGTGLADSAFTNLFEPLFREFKITLSVHKTTSKSSHQKFLKSIQPANTKENIVVIFGGDTMVFKVLNSMAKLPHVTSQHRFTLCPIPCGTGNALATSLGITTIPIGISRTFGLDKSSTEPVRLPLMKITIREREQEQVIVASVVCSWGLHASLVADSDDPEMRRQYGPQRFQVQLV